MLTTSLKNYNFWFKFLIFIFIISLPLTEAVKNISLSILFLLFLYELFLKKIYLKFNIVDIFILLHLLVAFTGILFGVNTQETLKQFPNLLFITFIYFFFRWLPYKKFEISEKFIFNTIFISFIIAGLYGFYEYFIEHYRYMSLNSVGSVNRSATYAMFIFVISFGYWLYNKNNLALVTFIFTIVFIFLTGSRMAIYTLPIMIIFLLYVFNRITIKNILISIIAIALLAMIFLYFFPDSRVAIKIKKGFNDPARIQIWISCIYIWLSHNIFFGIGMGNSIFFSTKTFFGKNAIEGYINNAHNTYLDMLLERGLFGLFTYLGFLLSALYKFWETKDFYLSKISMALIVSSLIMSFMNITFRYEFAMLFVIILGLTLNKIEYEKN
ncbi:O-antigen ligase family protein [Nitrosophilus alvini]|uniref:O-antigen ligase family protein n=1 Tax=Nitrosophilus alvini TaxID=2714855 RepID=UPI00190AD833|nr:O-antigen ligase family protein [Nitrosophilus alvini]